MKPTNRLRWVMRLRGLLKGYEGAMEWMPNKYLVLQQWWQESDCPMGEWRDIPIEQE